MWCVDRAPFGNFRFPERQEEVEGMCLSPFGVKRPQIFACNVCLDEFETQEKAEACRHTDGGDSISKAAAYDRRQRNEKRKAYAQQYQD